MAIRLRTFWKSLSGQRTELPTANIPSVQKPSRTPPPEVEIAPNDPIVAFFQSAPGVVEIDRLELDSPALQALKAAGVKLTVPLVSQGELIGLLNLGPRLSEQEYSSDDRGLLNSLATQAAPALRVAQLVRQQQLEAQARVRIEQEMRVARLIQQTLLPKELPTLPGWRLAAHYQPARAVGGDFYDFINLPAGQLGLVVGDVTDKGVPAALVMATTRSILRSTAEQFVSPGAVLERANDLLCPDIPPNMFVTCLYAVLEPESGKLVYANAGHDLPYRRSSRGVDELRATGMPLGLMPGMHYEQKDVILQPKDCVIFYSDGLVEAHNPQGEMFGFPRLRELLAGHPGGLNIIEFLLNQLADFTAEGWEQEDDVTFVILEHGDLPLASISAKEEDRENEQGQSNDPSQVGHAASWRKLAEFSLPSEPGNERQATEQVAATLREINLPEARLERLKTAVAEATMNAMEHGNQYQPELLVEVRVLASTEAVKVEISDQGGNQVIPEPETPDLEAKLAGLQTARGWGLFLIKNMVDSMDISADGTTHTIELIMYLEGDQNASKNP